MPTQTAAAKPKRTKRTQRQDTPQTCPDPIRASLEQLHNLNYPQETETDLTRAFRYN